jgi:protein-S-isoprenylcysteine O-methyltransferase Ste14
MKKKGQVGIQVLIGVFIAILVGVIIFQASAQQVGDSVNLGSFTNTTVTLASDGDSIYLTNYRALSDITVANASSGAVVPATNYTITNNVIYNGALAVQITTTSAGGYSSQPVNISATAQPLTYIDDSGGRAVANLIPIMFALLLVVVALYPTIKEKLSDMF